MPGCWEMAQANRVLCAILHTEHVSMSWALNLRSLQIPGPVVGLTGMPFDHARNAACMRALEWGVEHVFFLDSDVTPPPDAVHRLLRHGLPIVSGVYHRRSPPHGIPVMQRPAGRWIMSYPANSMMEVHTVGAGCLLIRRDVLEQLPPSTKGRHWFDWRVDLRGAKVYPDAECMSEDFVFCTNARKAGYKIMVDTSIQCGHIGLAEARYGCMIPANSQQIA